MKPLAHILDTSIRVPFVVKELPIECRESREVANAIFGQPSTSKRLDSRCRLTVKQDDLRIMVLVKRQVLVTNKEGAISFRKLRERPTGNPEWQPGSLEHIHNSPTRRSSLSVTKLFTVVFDRCFNDLDRMLATVSTVDRNIVRLGLTRQDLVSLEVMTKSLHDRGR